MTRSTFVISLAGYRSGKPLDEGDRQEPAHDVHVAPSRIIGALICLLLVAIWAFVPDKMLSSGVGTPYCRSSPGDVVELDISGESFAIPCQYIANVAYESDESISLVRLSVLWPAIEPLTEDNKHQWSPSLPGRQVISIIISNDARDEFQRLQNAIKLGVLGNHPEEGPFDLLRFAKRNDGNRRTTRRFVVDDQAYNTPSGSPLTFRCDDLFSWDAHRRMDLEPICTTDYTLASSTGLYYRFYRKNLENWQRIDSDIRSLVFSFRRNGALEAGGALQSEAFCKIRLCLDERSVAHQLKIRKLSRSLTHNSGHIA